MQNNDLVQYLLSLQVTHKSHLEEEDDYLEDHYMDEWFLEDEEDVVPIDPEWGTDDVECNICHNVEMLRNMSTRVTISKFFTDGQVQYGIQTCEGPLSGRNLVFGGNAYVIDFHQVCKSCTEFVWQYFNAPAVPTLVSKIDTNYLRNLLSVDVAHLVLEYTKAVLE